jgi:hypothetical protein
VTVSGDFFHFVASGPCEEYHRRAVTEIEAGLYDAESDCTVIVGSDGDRGGRDQIETADPTGLPRRSASGRSSG